ncbi:MAG: hypothetical protein AB8I08_33645 [Sandaracinaceae bacterium]
MVARVRRTALFLLLTACGASSSSATPETRSADLHAVGPGLRSCTTPDLAPESRCVCQSDRDCDERPGGACVTGSWGRGYPPSGTFLHQTCAYAACTTDTDCGADRACVHDPNLAALQVAQCVAASCSSDADCQRDDGSEGHCRRMSTVSHQYVPEIHCVYADSACDPEAGRVCPPHGEDDSRPPDLCIFQAGAPVCRRDPGPVP